MRRFIVLAEILIEAQDADEAKDFLEEHLDPCRTSKGEFTYTITDSRLRAGPVAYRGDSHVPWKIEQKDRRPLWPTGWRTGWRP